MSTGIEVHPGEPALLVGAARVHDTLNDVEASLSVYKQVLKFDPTDVEAIASLGAVHFYRDQPEIALRFV